MSPGHVRLRCAKADAIRRFRRWIGLQEVQPEQNCSTLHAVRLATDERGVWKGTAVLVGEGNGWTVFNDLSGFLQTCDAAELLALAENDDLIVAAYNDAIPFARYVVIAGGSIQRDFSHEPDDPAGTWSRGFLEDEAKTPIRTWIDVASRVDDEELDYDVDEGTLLVFGGSSAR